MTQDGSQIGSAMPHPIIHNELYNLSGLIQKTYCKDDIWKKTYFSQYTCFKNSQ